MTIDNHITLLARRVAIPSCLVLLAVAPFSALAASPATLCQPDEQVLFSCHVKYKDRIVSLCGSKDLAAAKGYLQYRFGAPDKIELQYPDPRENSQKALHYGHYFRAQVDQTRVYFNKEKYLYELFTDEEGDVTPKTSSKGVRSTDSAAPDKPNELACVGPTVNQLWKLETVLSCDPNESDCPSAK
jgi:hypothetical protein